MEDNLFESNNTKKRILCYGDSNTWGWVPSSMGAKRYNKSNRWTGVLQNLLGDEYEVLEEGLGARTTMFDDPRPEFPQRNGLATLPIILESHLPLSYVVIMLGTTDTKDMLSLDVESIVQGMEKLIHVVKKSRNLDNCSKPRILIVVPPIVKEDTDFATKLFKGATVKTTALVDWYKTLALQQGVSYLDPTREVLVDAKEGVHIDHLNHRKLALMIADKIRTL